MDFAEAVLGSDDQHLARAQAKLTEALGADALVDVAAVVGNFNAIDRIADATGIPIATGRRVQGSHASARTTRRVHGLNSRGL